MGDIEQILQTSWPILLMVVIFYFLLWRPQKKQQKERTNLLSSLKKGQKIVTIGGIYGEIVELDDEKVKVEKIMGHGGFFKTKGVGQKILAGAIDAPVSVMETAGEGGAWGIALLASYMINKEENETLEDYLDAKVFAGNAGTKMDPDPADVAGFEVFTERYKKGLPIERAAVESLK